MTTTTRRRTTPAAPNWDRRAATIHQTWEDRAACYNRPETWWDGDNPALTAKARQVCLTCPVMADCLADQMRREPAWARESIRGGLTPDERGQLHMDEQQFGPADAEEARLLALESAAFTRPVPDLVSQNVNLSTVRLASRLAGESVESCEKQFRSAEGKRVAERINDVLGWREDGVTIRQIASYLDVNEKTVRRVLRIHETSDPTAPSASEDGFVTADRADAYLRGESVQLSNEQRVAVLVIGVGRGLSYQEIDRRHGLSHGSTVKFVSRMRKRYEATGRDFPLEPAVQSQFTDEQVVEMRERYARGGVTDLDLALKYGVPHKTMSHILSGRRYKNAGGPIRPSRRAVSQASRDHMCGHSSGSQAAKPKAVVREHAAA